MNESSNNLFDRVPERIFRPLGAFEHARRNWAMLRHLYDDFFAPEAEPPDGDGWTQNRLVASLERFLQRWDDVTGDAGDAVTPLNVRAHDALKTLIDSEWLAMERIGFMQFVIMRPTVQSLFELLNTFAEQGPEFISGRVQSIRNNLNQVLADPTANAAVFQVAAKECSALLRMLNTTRMRVHEASELLRQQDAADVFLERFFGEYISSLYIGDYHDLFSRNHPLTSRWEIIDLVSQIVDEPYSRSQLRAWYRKNMRCRDDAEADLLIEADSAKVLALRDVDRLLARLKDAVTRANDQALGYLNYKVRSQGNFDMRINQAVDAIVLAADSNPEALETIPTGWSQGRLIGECALKLPTKKPHRRRDAVIQKRILSPEARARRLVRQIMKGNREVSARRILDYISRHVPPGGQTTSADMSVETINDLCVLAAFSRLGLIAEREERNKLMGVPTRNRRRELPDHLQIELTGTRFENDYLEAPCVRITRTDLVDQTDAN